MLHGRHVLRPKEFRTTPYYPRDVLTFTYIKSPGLLHHDAITPLSKKVIGALAIDPLSITAGAIAILQFSGVIINASYNYRSRVESSAKDAIRIVEDGNAVQSMIDSMF